MFSLQKRNPAQNNVGVCVFISKETGCKKPVAPTTSTICPKAFLGNTGGEMSCAIRRRPPLFRSLLPVTKPITRKWAVLHDPFDDHPSVLPPPGGGGGIGPKRICLLSLVPVFFLFPNTQEVLFLYCPNKRSWLKIGPWSGHPILASDRFFFRVT